MSDLSWITGLMALNTDALGFIPAPTVARQYVAQGRYVLQTNERGVAVGYLLHGAVVPGRILTISQHCIELDKRARGYGEAAFQTVLDRARLANCRAVVLNCAADLPSNEFWQAMGFQRTRILTPTNRRQRAIYRYVLDLWPTLWTVA